MATVRESRPNAGYRRAVSFPPLRRAGRRHRREARPPPPGSDERGSPSGGRPGRPRPPAGLGQRLEIDPAVRTLVECLHSPDAAPLHMKRLAQNHHPRHRCHGRRPGESRHEIEKSVTVSFPEYPALVAAVWAAPTPSMAVSKAARSIFPPTWDGFYCSVTPGPWGCRGRPGNDTVRKFACSPQAPRRAVCSFVARSRRRRLSVHKSACSFGHPYTPRARAAFVRLVYTHDVAPGLCFPHSLFKDGKLRLSFLAGGTLPLHPTLLVYSRRL